MAKGGGEKTAGVEWGGGWGVRERRSKVAILTMG